MKVWGFFVIFSPESIAFCGVICGYTGNFVRLPVAGS